MKGSRCGLFNRGRDSSNSGGSALLRFDRSVDGSTTRRGAGFLVGVVLAKGWDEEEGLRGERATRWLDARGTFG